MSRHWSYAEVKPNVWTPPSVEQWAAIGEAEDHRLYGLIAEAAREAGMAKFRSYQQSVEITDYDERSTLRVAIHEHVRREVSADLGPAARIIGRTFRDDWRRFYWVVAIGELP